MTKLFICDINIFRTISPFSSWSKRKFERVFSYALLQKALNILFGLEALPKIVFEENGKPRFKEFSDVHFSISHSGNFVAVAVSDSPCGVDIEIKKPRSERFIEKIMENENLDIGFYELWCLKEAYYKLMGEGELRRPSGIYFKDGEFHGPDGESVGKTYETLPDYALAVFSYRELPTEPVLISHEELFDAAMHYDFLN